MPQIPQLQIPQLGAVSGGIDFAPLGQLGQIYQKSQQDEANKAAFAAFQQTGDPRALLGSGDMNLARLGQSLQQHADTLRQQGVENKRADANLGINQQNATINQARAAREAADFENTPDQFVTRDGVLVDQTAEATGRTKGRLELEQRATAAEKAGIAPGTPEYKRLIATGELPKPVADHPIMDDDTASFLADRVIAGDNRALVGLGRGAQGAENIGKIQALVAQKAKAQGLNAEGLLNNVAAVSGLNSAYRTLGTTGTRFEVAEKAAAESFPLALAASANVPRTQWKTLTEFIQKGQTQSNDPNLRRFLIATDTAAKDYARTINPTGVLRESDIEYARKILSTADSPEAYSAAVDQLNQEVHIMGRALQRQRDEMKGRGGAVAPPTSTASSTAAAPVVSPSPAKSSAPMKWDDWLRSGNK
jgi:hypothetical protein